MPVLSDLHVLKLRDFARDVVPAAKAAIGSTRNWADWVDPRPAEEPASTLPVLSQALEQLDALNHATWAIQWAAYSCSPHSAEYYAQWGLDIQRPRPANPNSEPPERAYVQFEVVDAAFERVDSFTQVRLCATRLSDMLRGEECYAQYHAARMHPAVAKMIMLGYEWMDSNPTKAHGLFGMGIIREMPTIAADGVRVAYYQSTAKAMRRVDEDPRDMECAPLRTVCSVGSYLTRTFPDAPQTAIQEVVVWWNSIQSPRTVEFVYDADMTYIMGEAAIRYMEDGVCNVPYSCMLNIAGLERWEHHPYSVLSRRFGWGMAILRRTDDRIVGRALVWTRHDGAKFYIRSFGSIHAESRANSEELECKLQEMGYTKLTAAEQYGMYIEHERYADDVDVVAPYMDTPYHYGEVVTPCPAIMQGYADLGLSTPHLPATVITVGQAGASLLTQTGRARMPA